MRSAMGARSRPPADGTCGEGAEGCPIPSRVPCRDFPTRRLHAPGRGGAEGLLRVGDEERAELDRLEAGGQLPVLPGARNLLQAEVGLMAEPLVQLALAEHAAVVGVAVDRG